MVQQFLTPEETAPPASSLVATETATTPLETSAAVFTPAANDLVARVQQKILRRNRRYRTALLLTVITSIMLCLPSLLDAQFTDLVARLLAHDRVRCAGADQHRGNALECPVPAWVSRQRIYADWRRACGSRSDRCSVCRVAAPAGNASRRAHHIAAADESQ